MPGPLEGVRVIEFSEIIAGPGGGMLLADFGADVIKVEPPWGDPWRSTSPGPTGPNESRGFIAVNRGKRSIRVDLTKSGGRSVVHRLVEQADVIVLNHRPDVPAKLGIDYDTLYAINPKIIYCEGTAYGRLGPNRELPGYDVIVQAITGMMTSEGHDVDGLPSRGLRDIFPRVGKAAFVQILLKRGRNLLERQAHLLQYLFAPWRLACQDYPGKPTAKTIQRWAQQHLLSLYISFAVR